MVLHGIAEISAERKKLAPGGGNAAGAFKRRGSAWKHGRKSASRTARLRRKWTYENNSERSHVEIFWGQDPLLLRGRAAGNGETLYRPLLKHGWDGRVAAIR